MISGQHLLTACEDLWILVICISAIKKMLCLCMWSVNTWRELVVSSGFCCFTIVGLLTQYNLINLNVNAQ